MVALNGAEITREATAAAATLYPAILTLALVTVSFGHPGVIDGVLPLHAARCDEHDTPPASPPTSVFCLVLLVLVLCFAPLKWRFLYPRSPPCPL